ncbi:MAG: hypothetical protein PHT33_05220 [bacterium]|nr:hypothetical protein [bacterium]
MLKYDNMYKEAELISWNRLSSDDLGGYQPPLTVHMPIQPLHSPDFVFVDCALNVSRRKVLPELSVFDIESRAAVKAMECMFLQFAFDNPPFVPDLRRSQMSLAEGKYPVVQAQYYAWDTLYSLEYFCNRVDDVQSLLQVTVSVKNEGEDYQDVHVRAKLNFQNESDVFDYHYVPFYWDASKWLPCNRTVLEGDRLLRDGQVIGKVLPGAFDCVWEAEAHFGDDEYNKPFNCSRPYYVTPAMRLRDVENVLHFSAGLAPGEHKDFSITLLVNYEAVTAEHLKSLAETEPGACRIRALQYFKEPLQRDIAALVCPAAGLDNIFTELQTSTLQLLVRFAGDKHLIPFQGGSSERHYVWVWEAVCMLMPMLRLGHFKPVRQALEYIFTLQDGGCPPEGRFTTLDGAIGTTGPRWANSTGSALALAAEYYLYSHDEEFLGNYLDPMIRAARWITGEIRATRKLNSDGSRPLHYGLMPYACATDGDKGYVIAFTDSYSYWGLSKFVTMLELIRHKDFQEFRDEAHAYRTDIGMAVDGLSRQDGYINRRVPDAGTEIIARKFESVVGAGHLAYCDAVDITGDTFSRYIDYVENSVADGCFLGKMDREVLYMGVGEWVWHGIYLRLGQWKKAFIALQANLNYGITRDTFQVQERFSRFDPAFTPWQPNGSGNGKFLDMILKSFYYDDGSVVTLLGGIPFVWLEQNVHTELSGLYTRQACVSLSADITGDGKCALVLRTDGTAPLPEKIRVPGHLSVQTVSEGIEDIGRGCFRLPERDCFEARLILVQSSR